MTKSLLRSILVAVVWLTGVIIGAKGGPARAEEFVVRKVTNHGHPTVGAPTVPLAVLGDYLLYLAAEGARTSSIYRTDGRSAELIDDTLDVYLSLDRLVPGSLRFDVAQLGSELLFTHLNAPAASLAQSFKIFPAPLGTPGFIISARRSVLPKTPADMMFLN